MSLFRRNPRRDSNEGDVIATLERVGALVARMSITGMADLLVCHRGRLMLLEVKRPKARGQAAGKATKAQTVKVQQGWPVVVVRTAEEALEALSRSQEAR